MDKKYNISQFYAKHYIQKIVSIYVIPISYDITKKLQ